MRKVNVRIPASSEKKYSINIGSGLLKRLPLQIGHDAPASAYAIICDSRVAGLYGKGLAKGMKRRGIRNKVFSFRPGEKSKNVSTLRAISNSMLSSGLDRDSCVIALGGGVAGDLGGFVAATYMRGVSLVQVPTTLLAMVDSSIGGKVAVDLPAGKNACGTFYQPLAVYADTASLKTLSGKEFVNGMAEAIKHAMIADSELFRYIERNLPRLLSREEGALMHTIARNCEIKANIVRRDETERKEKGTRKILNYGHTVGHSLETATGYRRFTHGEAVALGMHAEGALANRLGILGDKALARQKSLLGSAGFVGGFPRLSSRKLVEIMKRDKKAAGGKIKMVLPRAVGSMKKVGGAYPIPVKAGDIMQTLREVGAAR